MKKKRPVHLEIQRHRKNYYGLIRSSYRQDGKVKHSTHGRIVGMDKNQLQLIQAAFRGDVVPGVSCEALKCVESKEYGASAAVLAVVKDLGLDRAIYSRPEAWVDDVLAMVVGRLIVISKGCTRKVNSSLSALRCRWNRQGSQVDIHQCDRTPQNHSPRQVHRCRHVVSSNNRPNRRPTTSRSLNTTATWYTGMAAPK
jgi:hypothetical protein